MLPGLEDLYQELILDHYRGPRNRGALVSANRRAEGHNPLCGDRVTLQLIVEDDTIRDLRFEGAGCAISTASASIMTEVLKGRTVSDALQLFTQFHRMATTGEPPAGQAPMGKLSAFSGISRYPARVKCATLAWHTLDAALRGQTTPVSTE